MKLAIKLFLFVVSVFLISTLTRSVHAETTATDSAHRYGITFPINDLGNCADISECKTYCQIEENKTKCTEFAKKKGFYKEPLANNTETLNAAKTELGCDSATTCKTFCKNTQNSQKCKQFAKEHNLGKVTSTDPKNPQILEKAKEALGCNSYETCKTFCNQETNRQKCAEFAKRVSIHVETEVKNNTQNSNQTTNIPESCRANLQECYQKCKDSPSSCKFNSTNSATPNIPKPQQTEIQKELFKKLGCDSSAACTQICKEDPNKCPSPHQPTIQGIKTGPLETIQSIINYVTSLF